VAATLGEGGSLHSTNAVKQHWAAAGGGYTNLVKAACHFVSASANSVVLTGVTALVDPKAQPPSPASLNSLRGVLSRVRYLAATLQEEQARVCACHAVGAIAVLSPEPARIEGYMALVQLCADSTSANACVRVACGPYKAALDLAYALRQEMGHLLASQRLDDSQRRTVKQTHVQLMAILQPLVKAPQLFVPLGPDTRAYV
jgi:hypothetical protein